MNLKDALKYAADVGLTDAQVALVVKNEADRVRFQTDNGLVTLTHPETGAEFPAHPDTIAQWEQAGWTRKQAELTEDRLTALSKEK